MRRTLYKVENSFSYLGRHLGWADLFLLSLRVFRTRPARTALTILGMGFGVGVVLFLVSLGYGLQFILLGNLASTQDSLVALETYYPSESKLKIDENIIDRMVKLPDVVEVSPVSEFPAEVKSVHAAGYLVARVVDEKYLRLAGTNIETHSDPKESSTPRDLSGNVIMSKAALTVLGFPPSTDAIGKRFSLDMVIESEDATLAEGAGMTITRLERLEVGGVIADDSEAPLVLVPLGLLPHAVGAYEKIYIKAASIEKVEPLRDQLIDLGFAVSARIDLVNQARNILTIITIILGIFGLASLVVSAIGMFNTMIIGFLERTFEVGVMKALGATNHDIHNIFLVESFVVGFLGGIVGILIGIGCASLFNTGLNLLAENLGGKPVNLFVRPWWFLISIMLVSSAIGIISGIIPAIRAGRLSPKEAFTRK